MNILNLSYGLEEEQLYAIAQIRLLYAAVLEFALRDLEAGSYSEMKDALKWFIADEFDSDFNDRFSFQHIADTLELSASRMHSIASSIAIAEERKNKLKHLSEKQKKKRGFCVSSDNYVQTKGVLFRVVRKHHKRRVSST